jgi:hypothetical protein
MFNPDSTDWPTGHVDLWEAPRPRGGVAPLRHDLALARYLEKQAAHRASSALSFFAWHPATLLSMRIAGGFAPLNPLPSERPRNWAG